MAMSNTAQQKSEQYARRPGVRMRIARLTGSFGNARWPACNGAAPSAPATCFNLSAPPTPHHNMATDLGVKLLANILTCNALIWPTTPRCNPEDPVARQRSCNAACYGGGQGGGCAASRSPTPDAPMPILN